MAELTLNINQWLCGNYRNDREANIGVNHFGNNEGQLLKQNHPTSKEHSMCCIGQFLNQAGINEKYLIGFGQPSDFNHSDEVEIDPESINREISDIFVDITEEDNEINFVDTSVANDLMEINDDDLTTVFHKIKAIRNKLEENGHTLKIEDPKGELDTLRAMVMESTKI